MSKSTIGDELYHKAQQALHEMIVEGIQISSMIVTMTMTGQYEE